MRRASRRCCLTSPAKNTRRPRADPIVRAAAKATGIAFRLVKGLLARAAAELKRRRERIARGAEGEALVRADRA